MSPFKSVDSAPAPPHTLLLPGPVFLHPQMGTRKGPCGWALAEALTGAGSPAPHLLVPPHTGSLLGPALSCLRLGTRKGPHQGCLSHAHGCQLPRMPHPHWGSHGQGRCCFCTPSSPGWSRVILGSLGNRPLWVAHMQRWG